MVLEYNSQKPFLDLCRVHKDFLMHHNRCLPNGSFDKFIYKSEFPNAICGFDWNTLFQIAIGTAKGLEYLHQGCSSRILHLDIKPQNIFWMKIFVQKYLILDLLKYVKGRAELCQYWGHEEL